MIRFFLAAIGYIQPADPNEDSTYHRFIVISAVLCGVLGILIFGKIHAVTRGESGASLISFSERFMAERGIDTKNEAHRNLMEGMRRNSELEADREYVAAMLPISLIFGLLFGVSISCYLAPTRFFESANGVKWMKLIGMKSVLKTRLVCLAFLFVSILPFLFIYLDSAP